MISFSRKYCLRFLLLFTLFDVTYSINDDTSTEGRRHSRVSGRIVKLYSGPKPNPIICQGEGFQADTVDCSVFYRCIKASNGKYTVYRFQCGPGTVYDPDTEICNHPQRTKRSECGELNSNKISQSTEGYKENEIESVHEENHELPSPISTKLPNSNNVISQTISTSKNNLLDNSYAATSYPFATTPKHVYAETSAASWSAQTLVTTKSPWGYVPPQLTSYVTRQPSSHGENQCTSDGFMGDSQDCRKFYRCVNNQKGGFIRYEFSCSESTIWDDSTQGCNHPWAVQRRRCGKGNNSYETNSIGYVNQINNNAPIENIGQQIIHDLENGNLHTQTSNNQTIENQTKNNFGERFSTEKSIIKQNQTQMNYEWALSQSDMETGYGNKITQTQGQGNLNKVNQTVSQSITTTTLSPEIYNSENICRKDGFIGDSVDCKKFYRCVSNNKGGFNRHEYSCSEGTLWDEKVEACNHAWAVKECGKKTIQNVKPTDAPFIKNTTTFSYSTVSSSSYINNEIEEVGYGSSKSPEKIEQPKSSTFSLNTQIYVTTENSILYSTDCKSSGFFGKINDCVTFYRCVENGNGRFTKYDYKCGDGTVWDPEIESCNHIWAVKNGCQNGSHKENIIAPHTENTIITTVSLIQTTTQRNIPDNDYDTGYGNTLQRETTAHSSIATATTERNQESKCTASGFIGDSKDCKKFYRCVYNDDGHYTKHEFICGEGTVWDPEIEACNHAWTVKQCGSSSINVSDNNNIQATTPLWVSESDSDSNNGYIPNKNNEEIETTPKSTTSNTMSSSVIAENNKPNECQTNGFMADNNDCKIFYRCVDSGSGGFIRYTFSCGDGTVWDPKITACNHESQVEKCGKSTSAHGSSTTHPPPTNSISSEMSIASTALHTTTSSTTTLSTVSDSHNQCVANGFIGHKQDCKKFFRCVDDGKGSFTRYEFTCGEGTVWDPKISACNHVWAVESCGAYVSSAGEGSSSHPPITVKDEETDNYVTQNDGVISSSSESNLGSSTTIKSITTSSLSKQCDREGFFGDVDDCKKFYRCVNNGKGFIRYEFSCGEGTAWDSEINACNHVNSVKNSCSSQSIQTSKEPEPNYTVSSEPESNNTATTPKEPLKSQECKQEGFIADNKDCKKFFRCTDNGEGGFYKFEFTCGEGTIWDQSILACNHESADQHCIPVSAETQTQDSLTSVSSPTSYPDETHSTEKIEITTSADECMSEGFYANSNDCKKFFRCVGDGKGGFTKYDFTCGDGTIWVQDIQACDHDNDLSHCSKTTTTTTPTSITPSEASKETPISPISTLTSSSTEESQTKPTMLDETEPGSSSTTESSTSTNNDICDESGYFGNSKDCKKFYRCVDNSKGGYTKYDYTCGDGTIWDQDITACNHPQDVTNPSCKSEETDTGTTTTMSSESSETTTKGTSSSESSTEFTSATTTTTSSNQGTQDVSTKKPNTNYTCTEAGYYADPYDCKKFYRCVNWGDDKKTFSIYHFDCGEGTIWDPALETCNHEDSVYPPRDCSGTQSQNENNTDTTTTEGTTTKPEETTQSSTTEKSTTTQSTTPKASTESSSTGESTTVQTSTQQSSTSESSSTQQSTTQQSTTEQSTTKQSTTEQSTTPQSTTTSEQTTSQQSSTTQKSTTAEQSTSTTTEQTTTDHTTTDQTTTTEQTTTTSSSTEGTTTSSQASSSESATSTTEQTTQESTTEQSSENQSSTTEGSSTTQEPTETTSTTDGGQDTTTEKETSDKDCPETDDDQYLYVCPTGFKRHPKYCNLFYQCTEDDDSHEVKVAVFTCPNNTIYDESKIQCVEEQKADKKCEGKIAQRRRVKRLDTNYKEPIIVSKDTYTCPTKGHFPFEKNEECSTVLFKCEITKSGKLRGLVYQCPEGYVYWSISRRCEPLNAMTHCKRSLSNWNGRYELPVEKRNVARETTIK